MARTPAILHIRSLDSISNLSGGEIPSLQNTSYTVNVTSEKCENFSLLYSISENEGQTLSKAEH
jgi:hypothetical protein